MFVFKILFSNFVDNVSIIWFRVIYSGAIDQFRLLQRIVYTVEKYEKSALLTINQLLERFLTSKITRKAITKLQIK